MAMKVIELMTGDLIQVKRGLNGHLTNEKIKGLIDDDAESYPITLDTEETVSLNDVVPIPLTEDILVKNGLRKGFLGRVEGQNFEEDENLLLELTVDKDGSVYWTTNWNEYSVVALPYVHSLQHALRLCGIEKELIID